MRGLRRLMSAILMLAVTGSGAYQAAGEDPPKYTIAQVMQMAHKPPAKGQPSLLITILQGKASRQDKEKLLDLYTALGQNKLPRGDAKSWKGKTEALVNAARSILAEEKGAGEKLKNATTCMACHDVHKADD